MDKEKTAKVVCPKCGTKFDVENHDEMVVPAFHSGTDDVIGTLVPSEKGESKMSEMKLTQEINFKELTKEQKAEVLKAMGYNPIDVMDVKVGTFDNVVEQIYKNGWIKNQKVHRRFLPAQTMHLIGWRNGITSEDKWTKNMNARYHYFSQFEILEAEFKALSKMEFVDLDCFAERVQFFNKGVAIALCRRYISDLNTGLRKQHIFHCKGIPYIKFAGQNIFVSDIETKIISPLTKMVDTFERKSTTYKENFDFIKDFYHSPLCRTFVDCYKLPKCAEWVDAFKGAGAYFTMQNFIRYDGLNLVEYKTGKILDRDSSLEYLERQTNLCKPGERYKLLALLKNSLVTTKFDFDKVVKETEERRKLLK